MAAARRCDAGPGPAETTTFVGRDDELEEATRLLRTSRVTTMVGPGGVGKTRLALRVATPDRTGAFDHVHVVDLAALNDAALLEATVAEAAGIRDESGALTLDDVVAALAGRRVLLVLDGCEHLVDACAALAGALLRAAPGVTLLATSRRPLVLPGEHVLQVPPLALPQPDAHRDVAVLARSPAVTLLLDRARAAAPGFTLTAANAGAVAGVCSALDGLPLALELAAVRLRALSPAQLLDRLERHHQVLAAGTRTAHPHQRTLADLMDWSFRLCSDQERVLWARMSIFKGGFDLTAAEQVCSGDGIAEDEIADLVTGLVDKSVLLRDDRGAHPRYRLLETIRRYGLDRLSGSGGRDTVRVRHREHLQRLVDDTAAHWFGPDDATRLERLRREHANLREALDGCTRDPSGVDAGLRLATGFWLMWRAAGWVSEGRHWLDRLLSAASEPQASSATALWVAGWLALVQGDRESAVALLRRSEDAARRGGDRAASGFVDLFLGQAATVDGDLDEARHRLGRALEAHHRTGDPAGLALGTFRLAVCHAAAGDAEAAVATAQEARRFCHDRGALWWSGYAGWITAVALWCRGDGMAAADEAAASLTVTWDHGDELGAAMALEVLAWVSARSAPLRAAELLGSLHRRWPRAGSALAGYGTLIDHHDRCVEEVRGLLGEDRYAAAHAGGAAQRIGEIVDRVLHGWGRGDTGTPLTARELEVAELVADGRANKEIARTLGIAVRTAETHVEHIRTKLGFHSRARIAAWVVERRAGG